jgi:hypothetical protein
MRLSLLTFFVWLMTVVANAQTSFSGRVVADGSKKGLGWASVVAEDSRRKPIAFAQTKEDGTFELKVPESKKVMQLSFSLLGYAKKSIDVDNFTNGQKIILREETLMLKEVKATSKRLRQRSDTLVYSVAGFRHKQDRSIADVIAKMPGLEVRQDGSILFQGKPINNFYIEGMNMMGNNYSVASENINANKVKNVEVLTNHQKVKALRGVQFSDQAALNLVLEEDAKNTWVGLLETGLGTTLQKSEADRLLRDGRLMAMMFGGKMQSLSMYKWNNTGKNIQREIRDLQNSIDDIGSVSNMTSGIGLSAPGLMRERYAMNDSRLLATNWLHKAGQDATIRLQLNGYLDNTEGKRYSETIYSDLMGGAVITEDANGENRHSQWKGELKYERNGAKLFVVNVLSGYMDFDKSWASTLTNDKGIRQETTPRKRWVGDHLEIVKALGNDRVLKLNASGVINYLPGSLLLTDSSRQHIDQHATQLRVGASFRHKLFHRLYVSYNTGVDYDDERFTIRLHNQKPQSDSYQQLNCYFEPSFNIKYNDLEWTTSMPLRLVSRHFGNESNTKMIVTPMMNLRYQILSQLTVMVNYNYDWQPTSLEDMTAIPVYSNYRNYSTGFGKLYAENSHNGMLRFEYSDPVIGLFGNINGNLMYYDDLPLYNSQLDGIFYHSSPSGDFKSNTTWMLSGRISKSLGTMKFIAAVDGQLSSTHTSTMINGLRLPFRYDRASCGVSFSIRPLQTLSFEEESHYQYSRQVSTSDHSFDSRALHSFTHTLKTFYMPKNWQIEWTNEMYHSNDHSVSFTYFSDIQVSYRTKKWEAGIQMNNIFGTRQYERHYISSYYTRYTISHLRPREILCKISFDM